MINLIPPDARTQVKREYWTRVISVWMMLAATAFVMITLLRVPVFVLVSSQLNAFADSYERAASEDLQFKESEELIVEANEIGRLLSESNESRFFSAIITKLDELSGEGITISSISIERTDDIVSAVSVIGFAETRFSLASFKDRIEADPYFESAALPLSNLAKDKDIPFNIAIKPLLPDKNHDS